MLYTVVATFACDGCGTPFTVRMDESQQPPKGWALMECAEDAIRGGCNSLFESPSIGDAGEHFCPTCTKEADLAITATN